MTELEDFGGGVHVNGLGDWRIKGADMKKRNVLSLKLKSSKRTRRVKARSRK